MTNGSSRACREEYAMRPRRPLPLTADQRTELVAARDHDARPYLREIAAALLKIADGQPAYLVARQGLLRPRHPETVYGWMTRYEHGGLANLLHKPRGRRGFPPSAGERVG